MPPITATKTPPTQIHTIWRKLKPYRDLVTSKIFQDSSLESFYINKRIYSRAEISDQINEIFDFGKATLQGESIYYPLIAPENLTDPKFLKELVYAFEKIQALDNILETSEPQAEVKQESESPPVPDSTIKVVTTPPTSKASNPIIHPRSIKQIISDNKSAQEIFVKKQQFEIALQAAIEREALRSSSNLVHNEKLAFEISQKVAAEAKKFITTQANSIESATSESAQRVAQIVIRQLEKTPTIPQGVRYFAGKMDPAQVVVKIEPDIANTNFRKAVLQKPTIGDINRIISNKISDTAAAQAATSAVLSKALTNTAQSPQEITLLHSDLNQLEMGEIETIQDFITSYKSEKLPSLILSSTAPQENLVLLTEAISNLPPNLKTMTEEEILEVLLTRSQILSESSHPSQAIAEILNLDAEIIPAGFIESVNSFVSSTDPEAASSLYQSWLSLEPSLQTQWIDSVGVNDTTPLSIFSRAFTLNYTSISHSGLASSISSHISSGNYPAISSTISESSPSLFTIITEVAKDVQLQIPVSAEDSIRQTILDLPDKIGGLFENNSGIASQEKNDSQNQLTEELKKGFWDAAKKLGENTLSGLKTAAKKLLDAGLKAVGDGLSSLAAKLGPLLASLTTPEILAGAGLLVTASILIILAIYLFIYFSPTSPLGLPKSKMITIPGTIDGTVGNQYSGPRLPFMIGNNVCWPVYGYVSGYTPENHPSIDTTNASAIDLGAPYGTPIITPFSGIVTSAGWNTQGYGYLVEIGVVLPMDYAGNAVDRSCVLRFGHLSTINYSRNIDASTGEAGVEVGQAITKGTIIGTLGSTGNSTGPHLHYEIRCFDSYPAPDIRSLFPQFDQNIQYEQYMKAQCANESGLPVPL